MFCIVFIAVTAQAADKPNISLVASDLTTKMFHPVCE